MGYTTEFEGNFELKFNDESKRDHVTNLIDGLSSTRRMKRDLSKIQDKLDKPYQEYGTQGEFYFNKDSTNSGQEQDFSILDYNNPPETQPGLWLHWEIPEHDKDSLEWDQGEKFYNYTAWLEYLIKAIFIPNNVEITGSVEYRGEEWSDKGTINIENNTVTLN